MSGTQRVAVGVFAALVAATIGAFFVAQNLKNGPSVLQQFRRYPFFSPNGDGRFDGARVSFKLRETDDVTIEVVDDKGDTVAEIYDRRVTRYTPTQVRWSGRLENGRVAPDGVYRYRFTLRRQGRSILVPQSFRLDTTPPKPRIVGIGPVKDVRPQPELLPNPDGAPARVSFDATGTKKRVLLFKTGPGPVRPAMAPVALPDDATSWEWDGKVAGRKVSPGTYLAVIEVRDQAGNIGTSIPLDRRGLPATTYGSPLPGRGGITVRYLGVQPPIQPTRAGERGEFFVDARQQRYTWNLRRVGGPPQPIRRGSGTRAKLAISAPDGAGGVYLLEVRTRTRSVRVPWVVRPSTPRIGTRQDPSGVLVVLPVGTWQGRNPVDDDGDGLPDLLDRGLPVRLRRVMVGDGTGLPTGFAQQEAPLLAHLDRTQRRYDVTTDVALAAGTGPQLTDGYRGVILPGDVRWLPPAVGKALRGFVRRGGRVSLFGTRSLLREVRQTPRERWIEPTAPATRDLFGMRLGPLTRRSAVLTEFQDELDLFQGTEGQFAGVEAYEETTSTGSQSDPVAAAVTPGGKPVILAARFGEGIVIRTGLPDLPANLSRDEQYQQLVRRIWTLSR
ncbi:N,N-dimethylformamidase beta subunit family domain-containing protein [Paraconexibacter sp.]|uniref:N,N-dimethylformamidase beta subunit family domain-containing protein n=1 Tax=Paraconexibacter sp. TaxID=2949640 RepID=UPI003566EFEC